MLKREAVGYTEVNGLVDQKDGMEFDKVQRQRQNMKERGLVDCKMDMDQKLMLMEVRQILKNLFVFSSSELTFAIIFSTAI